MILLEKFLKSHGKFQGASSFIYALGFNRAVKQNGPPFSALNCNIPQIFLANWLPVWSEVQNQAVVYVTDEQEF
jgi:hypothetical protein